MEKQAKLDELKEKMDTDKSLPLREGATNLVFGEGSSHAKLMFIGEGPGYWEDQKARPFVGNAGAFLNQLLAVAGLERKDVYITNVIHFRAPANRDPAPSEIEAFQPYLDGMINIIRPKVIVTLGRYSMAKFLPGAKISTAHGKAKVVNFKNREYVIVPMYHPAAGLRSSAVKFATIEDFRDLVKIVKSAERIENEVGKKKEEKSAQQMSLV